MPRPGLRIFLQENWWPGAEPKAQRQLADCRSANSNCPASRRAFRLERSGQCQPKLQIGKMVGQGRIELPTRGLFSPLASYRNCSYLAIFLRCSDDRRLEAAAIFRTVCPIWKSTRTRAGNFPHGKDVLLQNNFSNSQLQELQMLTRMFSILTACPCCLRPDASGPAPTRVEAEEATSVTLGQSSTGCATVFIQGWQTGRR